MRTRPDAQPLLPLFLGICMTTLAVADSAASEAPEPAGPAWSRNMTIYEVSQGQYGYHGDFFTRFIDHLPVLDDMGVGVVWLMPIHPRGGWGSAYCVKDYLDIDPTLGTRDDFRRFVDAAHARGMRIMLDWVPNHTAWENPLIQAHPEFYKRDEAGKILHPGPWKDVAALDFANRDLWAYQRDAMLYWVREFGVDGFRMDVAGRVPDEFWNWLRPQLDEQAELLMLAEANKPSLHPAFDMTYDWDLPPVMWKIAAGLVPATAIDDLLADEREKYPAGAVRMRFLTNHDWHHTTNPGSHTGYFGKDLPRLEGDTIMLRYGDGVRAFMVLCATLPGKPLVFSGQEMGDGRHKPGSPQQTRESPRFDFYRRLLTAYRDLPALHRGSFTKLATDRDEAVYAYLREHGDSSVLVALNLSNQPQTFRLAPDAASRVADRAWTGLFDDGAHTTLPNELEAWGYLVWVGSAAGE